MKTTLNLLIDPALMATVAAQLKNSELGRLFRALAAHMAGEDAGQYLTNSGLRLAYALLSPSIDESLERKAVASARGARGGRPRKEPDCRVASSGTAENGVSTKKSKKEDLPPTPPIEEKIKKNNPVVVDEAHEREMFKKDILDNDLRREQACMSLHIDPGEYRQLACEIFSDWEFNGEQEWSLKHLLNTMRIKVRDNNRNKHQYHGQIHQTRRDITDTTARSAKDYQGPF